MSLSLQAKALRLLQEQQFERVGGNQTIETDVRVIAATNKDLNAMVREGKFRLDLLYRLNGFTIQLPPLRDRLEDLPLLVEHFIRKFNRELGKNVHGVADATMRLLTAHDWPGNIRELQSVVNYAMVQCAGESILPGHLPDSFHVSADGGAWPIPETVVEGDVLRVVREGLARGQEGIYDRACEIFDRIVLGEVLRQVQGNQREAARLLGMSRVTLRSKLRSLGLPTSGLGNDDSTVG
jgi:two-component system nitrogen regulation response regulator GlnG